MPGKPKAQLRAGRGGPARTSARSPSGRPPRSAAHLAAILGRERFVQHQIDRRPIPTSCNGCTRSSARLQRRRPPVHSALLIAQAESLFAQAERLDQQATALAQGMRSRVTRCRRRPRRPSSRRRSRCGSTLAAMGDEGGNRGGPIPTHRGDGLAQWSGCSRPARRRPAIRARRVNRDSSSTTEGALLRDGRRRHEQRRPGRRDRRTAPAGWLLAACWRYQFGA